MMVMGIGETFLNNKVGYHSVVSQNELNSCLKYFIYFGQLVKSKSINLQS